MNNKFFCQKGTCKEEDQCNHCWSIENPLLMECSHHPFDRDVDQNENEICAACGKVMKTSDELYGNQEKL